MTDSDWDELHSQHIQFYADLGAERGVKYPTRPRDKFREWISDMDAQTRETHIRDYHAGYQQVMEEGRQGINQHLRESGSTVQI